jgi:DNA invertase Pin-like site-specific DNA recombinase
MIKYTALYCQSPGKDSVNRKIIKRQKKLLTGLAKSKGIKKYRFYVDYGYSAFATERPSLKRIFKDAKKGKIADVIFEDADRLGAYWDWITMIKEILAEYGVRCISMNPADWPLVDTIDETHSKKG